MDLTVEWDSEKLHQNQFVPSSEIQEAPRVEFTFKPGTLYTLIAYDLDAPYPGKNSSLFLHWLVVDIPDRERILFSYLPPSPPKDSPAHRYVIALYRQPGPIEPKISTRSRFSLSTLVDTWGLTLVDSIVFRSK
jgi:phosphatidylethanolamine-binding protein (PEBP) family uncharacterized protein